MKRSGVIFDFACIALAGAMFRRIAGFQAHVRQRFGPAGLLQPVRLRAMAAVFMTPVSAQVPSDHRRILLAAGMREQRACRRRTAAANANANRLHTDFPLVVRIVRSPDRRPRELLWIIAGA